MKSLTKLFTLGFMVLALISCGKEQNSGGSSSGSNNSNWYSNGGSDNGSSFGDINSLRSYYNSKSMTDNLENPMAIYRTGPEFGGQSFSNSNSGSFSLGYCINLFGKTYGDCGQSTGQTNYASILDRGEYITVQSASSSAVNYNKAISATNNYFNFQGRTFDRNNSLYQEMLNLDGKEVQYVVITPATIRLKNNQTIPGDHVEYFYMDGSRVRFVLSKSIPVIANPITVTRGNNLTGILNFAGSKQIAQVSVKFHEVSYDWQTAQFKATQTGQGSINL